jgi:small subunit ribosomal protein S20
MMIGLNIGKSYILFGALTLANTPQAKKRARQNEKSRVQNTAQRSKMRTHVKKVVKALGDGKVEVAKTAYQTMTSEVDKLVTKGLIHKNKAARHKSRLYARIKALAEK